jgi:purine-binding chemotaxis protein CheW
MVADNAGEALELLVFELAGARYALDLSSVREVVRAVFITPLPGAPAVVEGVISVRGEIVPVYDFRARFGLAARPLHPDDIIVTAWTGERRVGIRCEGTEWVRDIPRGMVEDAPAFAPGSSGHRLAGVVRLDDGLVLIHDLRTFLEQSENAELERALVARAEARVGPDGAVPE